MQDNDAELMDAVLALHAMQHAAAPAAEATQQQQATAKAAAGGKPPAVLTHASRHGRRPSSQPHYGITNDENMPPDAGPRRTAAEPGPVPKPPKRAARAPLAPEAAGPPAAAAAVPPPHVDEDADREWDHTLTALIWKKLTSSDVGCTVSKTGEHQVAAAA